MVTNVNFSKFCDAFRDYGRKDQFSYDGKQALFDYLEEYEDSTGEQIELDVIALCCEYTEYQNVQEAYTEHYGDDSDLPLDQRRTEPDQQLEYFTDNTQVIEFSTGLIIQNF